MSNFPLEYVFDLPRYGDIWMCADGTTLPWSPLDPMEKSPLGLFRHSEIRTAVVMRPVSEDGDE